MLAADLLKWALVLLLFVGLPIALIRLLVHRTIELPNKLDDKR